MAEDMERILGPRVGWTPCSDDTLELVASTMRSLAARTFAALRVLSGEEGVLPFGRGHRLLDLRVDGVAGIDRAFVIDAGDSYVWLDGTAAPVHTLNGADDLELTEDQVVDYLRWFLFAVRGDGGAFVLIEDETSLTDDDPDSTRLAEVRSKLIPVAVTSPVDDDEFGVDASVAYGDQIFSVQFAVDPSGNVEMRDDDPVAERGDLGVPAYPHLAPMPTELAEHASTDAQVTSALVSVLLAAAVREQLGHTLLQRFDTRAGADGWSAQLLLFVEESAPTIVIESEIPFAEEIVADLLDPSGERFTSSTRQRAEAVSGDDAVCALSSPRSATEIILISFHAYRSLWDTERTAYELSVGPASVLIGCDRVGDVPDALRRVTDLVLTLPRIDPSLFGDIFQRIFHAPVPAGWDGGHGDASWTRYLLHTDFHAPIRLGLTAEEALAYLRERCQERLRQVSTDDAPALDDLHGLGEARQIAEDLIADIAAARSETIPWSSVDRGLLLVGAPGTGKTTLARAIARECGIKFVQASAAQWQAAGALDAHLRALRETFAEARRYAPAILFLDEIDSIGSRDLLSGPNAIYQTEVINALLEQIQGMDADEPVVVIGATNAPDLVDPALRRAGRLDQVVAIPRPNVAGLTAIFEHYLHPYRDAGSLDGDVDELLLAQLAFGATGADVEFFVRGAARRARKDGRILSQVHLVAEVTHRPRHDDNAVRLSPDELRRVAVHEAGHALLSLLGSNAGSSLTYISVIPRMDGSLGFVASAPREGASITRRECLEQIEIACGGRAAEALVFGADEVSLGAGGDPSSDLAIATNVATTLVCRSGLGGDGSLLWTPDPTPQQLVQVDELLRAAYLAAEERLRLNRPTLEKIADLLVRDQEVDGETLRAFASELVAGPGPEIP